MPARAEEVDHARQEGIDFQILTAPLEFLADDKGWLKGRVASAWNWDSQMRLVAEGRCRSGARNSICRYRWRCLPSVPARTPAGLGTNQRGYIQASEETQPTTRKGVFAGGDIVTGSATVILAMGAGRRAAGSIYQYLLTGEW